MAQRRRSIPPGLNSNIHDSRRNPFDKKDYNLLKDFAEELAPYADLGFDPPLESLVNKPFSSRPKIIADAGRSLLRDRFLTLQAVTALEEEQGVHMLAALNDRPHDSQDPCKNRDKLHRAAVHAWVRQ
jgi:hypothetical protein